MASLSSFPMNMVSGVQHPCQGVSYHVTSRCYTVNFHLGQDLLPHSSSGSSELNGTIRLSGPAVSTQSAGTTLTISNDQLLTQSATLTSSGTQRVAWPGKTWLCRVVRGTGPPSHAACPANVMAAPLPPQEERKGSTRTQGIGCLRAPQSEPPSVGCGSRSCAVSACGLSLPQWGDGVKGTLRRL